MYRWWTTQQVYGPKNAFSELMDLSDTPLQVDGPPAHFTLVFHYCNKKNMTTNIIPIA
jgi:hypothetical protein